MDPLAPQADSHEYFQAALPWTENLLPGGTNFNSDVLPNCQECASDSSWTVITESSCRLVWLQIPREFHPLASHYVSLIGKDPFFAKGRSWKCVSVVIHQGHDLLNGEDQPAEHFYVLENDGPKCEYYCYNNAAGLHHADDTKIRPGDRICALLFRTSDITTKWPLHCTLPNRRQQRNNVARQEKGKRGKNMRGPRVLLSSTKRTVPGKQSTSLAQKSMQDNAQDTYGEELYGPPEDDIHIVPVETISNIEDYLSQSHAELQSTLSKQQGNGDPCRLSLRATGTIETPHRLGNSPARPGPYTLDDSKGRAGATKNIIEIAKSVSSKDDADISKPPYAILSMFDGCGSSVDIIESKIGYRPNFWFTHPIRYDRDWHDTLSAYRRCVSPWPHIPEPTEQDYIEHLLLTKDSAPGPDGLPYALWRVFPQQTAMILSDDFHHILSGTLAPPTQVGVWIPKAKQGPTADFFRPLGMPDTLDRLQDGTAAAILFRVTRHSFHPAQTLLNSFENPKRAVLEVQGALEGSTPASALFADLSKAFERVNAHWILHILRIRQCTPWVLQLARYLLFGRRIRHKVQGRLLPARDVHSGVDMGRSTSVYFFCLAMDPIFVVLNRIARVFVVVGYVDDNSIVGHQEDSTWVEEVFKNIRKWRTAGFVMDMHNCWQVGFSNLRENILYKVEEVWSHVTPIHEDGQATCSAALQRVPSYARHFVLRHGDHCIQMPSEAIPRLSSEGRPLLCRLAASPCQCRSKTQLLTNAEYTPSQLYRLDHAGLGGQCIVPSTVNLGLTLHTGWTCQLTSNVMIKTQIQSSMTNLLSKQLAKFRTRLAAANRANLSIHAKIIYFNTFSLSLFYYSQTHRFFSPALIKPLYQAMADFLLKRHWFPQHLLVGLCRWLRIGPLLDPAIMQAISLFGCYLRQGYKSLEEEHEGSYAAQIQQCWRYWQAQLPAEDIQRLLVLLRQDNTPTQRAGRFKHFFKQTAIARLLEASHRHLTNRIHQNGWALGPSIEFLGWLADLPTAQVGAVPRYAVLRWALGEDADFWLPLRGKLSRSQPCLWCQNNTRCFPQGPGYGASCPSCFQPAAARDVALHNLVEESHAFLQFHKIEMPPLTRLPPAFSRLAASEGCRAPDSYVPCVLCQRGINSIDH